MTTVVKAKLFDPSQMSFAKPKHIISNSYVVPLMYDGCKLMVQLPRTTISNAMYEVAGKFYFDILTPQNSVLAGFVRSISHRMKEQLRMLTEYNLHLPMFNDHITRVSESTDNEVFCSIRIKIPRQGNQFQCDVTNVEGRRLCVTDLKPGGSILCIVSIENIYAMGDAASFHMNAVQLKVMDGSRSAS